MSLSMIQEFILNHMKSLDILFHYMESILLKKLKNLLRIMMKTNL